MRNYSDTFTLATNRINFLSTVSSIPHAFRCFAATLTIGVLNALAALGPSYRPTTRSTITPYIGHCLGLLRLAIDPRPHALLTSFTDGFRLLLVL